MSDIPPTGPPAPPAPGHVPDDPPYVGAEARPSRAGLVGLGVGVLAAVGAGVFAVAMLSAGDGSSSPEAAVERMFDAVGEEDVIGVLEALVPGERSALQSGFEDVAGELRRLGIVSEDFHLGAVGGVDLQFDGLSLEREDLGQGVAAVRITGGTVTTSTRPDEVPIGPTLGTLLEHFGAEPEFEATTTTEDLATGAPVIVAVDHGDGWHVSLSYSVAEGIRRDAGEAVPVFGQGVQARGAESPEAAVRQAVEAAVDLDLRRVVELVSPAEVAALHDYAPLFLDDVEAAVAEMREEVPFDVDVSGLDLSAESDGDVARVRLGGFDASGTLPGLGRFSASFDGDCATLELAGEVETTCASDLQQPGSSPVSTEMVISTVHHDGQWYVSPTRTLFEQVLGALRALDREDLDDPESLFRSLFGGVGSAFTGMPEEVISDAFDVSPGPDEQGFLEYGPGSASDECFSRYEDLPLTAEPEDYDRIEREVQGCLDQLFGE